MVDSGYRRFVRLTRSPADDAELAVVDGLAARLSNHLIATAADIDAVHLHGAGSSAVQAIVARLLTDELGFEQEVVLTPEDGLVTRARPDFIYRTSPGRGILAEVERGGTTTNNHDLKDFWKTHIALDAQHLFLIVPLANWNQAGSAREKPFQRVLGRLGAFFGDPRKEVDVLSLHVFGYGRTALADAEEAHNFQETAIGVWPVDADGGSEVGGSFADQRQLEGSADGYVASSET